MEKIMDCQKIKLGRIDRSIYTSSAIAEECDKIDEAKLMFLQRLMEDTTRMKNVKMSSEATNPELAKPVITNVGELLNDLQIRFKLSWSRESKELLAIFNALHFKTLLECHDNIAHKMNNAEYHQSECTNLLFSNITGTIRMVGIRKKIGEPLGLTVLHDNDHLIVARILKGGIIEKQELLHVGDTILAVNGIQISKPEELQNEISKPQDHVTLKVSNSTNKFYSVPPTLVCDENGICKPNICYMRTLFKYNSEEDSLLPCKEIGLSFERGEILQIVDQKDPNWWQARKVAANGQTGLIPSIELEERRKAFVAEKDNIHQIAICGAKIIKKKKRIVYQTRTSSKFDKDELLLYEEVTKMPPFKRNTLVLIGTEVEQKKILKNALRSHDPDKFGVVMSCTSKPPENDITNGQYYFVDHKSMEEDIKNNKYLEYREHNGNLYGIHFDSIREIILQGKMCIIDCSPISLKILHNSSEFLPFVVFVCPSEMKNAIGTDVCIDSENVKHSARDSWDENRQQPFDDVDIFNTYVKYFDLVLPSDNFLVNVQRIMNALEVQATEQQWIPVNWIY